MTTVALELDGQAPAGWTVSLDERRHGDTYLSFTRDSERGQRFAPEINVSVREAPDLDAPLEIVAQERQNVLFDAYPGGSLRRCGFISRHDPDIYGHEIRFEAKFHAGDRVAIVQSEVLVASPGFRGRVLSFLLTAPESMFEDCARDFRKLFDSIVIQESQ